MKEHEEGYSMPLAAPTFHEAPVLRRRPTGKILMMAYRADPAAVAFEVPEPLEPVEPNLMLAWLGDMGPADPLGRPLSRVPDRHYGPLQGMDGLVHQLHLGR